MNLKIISNKIYYLIINIILIIKNNINSLNKHNNLIKFKIINKTTLIYKKINNISNHNVLFNKYSNQHYHKINSKIIIIKEI